MSLTGAGLRSMRSIPTFGTIGAIAEVVDNSIQWKTERDVEINIVFVQKDGNIEDILISDNGKGMGLDEKGREIIDFCLMFGGGTNHGATTGLGKFGIGLPYGCCSQSEDYHVYSWQKKNEIKHKWRNHKDIGEDEPVVDKPHEKLTAFPKYFDKYITNLNSYGSGTIIHWKNCDKLTYKKAVTLINHLEQKLGRIYRHFIGHGVTIHFKAYNQPQGNSPTAIEDLCKEIRKFDPLFLETGTIAPAPHDSIPSSELFAEKEHVFLESTTGINHVFKIRASLAKKEIQMPNCNAGGKTKIGDLYGTVQGISLVRAKRELKIGHFDFPFPNNIADQRHRWWKVEVSFEPVSDQILDVNANKTDAQHFRFISDEDVQNNNIDYIKLRYELSGIVNNLISEMWKQMQTRIQECKEIKSNRTQTCPYCKENTLINGLCTNDHCKKEVLTCQKIGHEDIILVNGRCAACDEIETSDKVCSVCKSDLDENGKCPKCDNSKIILTEEEEEELVTILKPYREFNGGAGGTESIKSLINWFARVNKKHFVIFVSDPVNKSRLFDIIPKPGKFDIILVNKNHPFYENHIGPLRALVASGTTLDSEEYNLEEALGSLILFIITWAETEKSSTSDQSQIQRFRNRFGINLEEILDNWNANK